MNIKGGNMKKVKISPKGRVCKFPNCKHVISVYNHEEYCRIHLSLVDPDLLENKGAKL